MNIGKAFPLLALATLMHVSDDAYAQAGTAATPDSDRTVVTLYSEVRPAQGVLASGAGERRAPIQIADGGVKSPGDSCWKLSETGEVMTLPGDCYELRSAQPGETPPAR